MREAALHLPMDAFVIPVWVRGTYAGFDEAACHCGEVHTELHAFCSAHVTDVIEDAWIVRVRGHTLASYPMCSRLTSGMDRLQ